MKTKIPMNVVASRVQEGDFGLLLLKLMAGLVVTGLSSIMVNDSRGGRLVYPLAVSCDGVLAEPPSTKGVAASSSLAYAGGGAIESQRGPSGITGEIDCNVGTGNRVWCWRAPIEY